VVRHFAIIEVITPDAVSPLRETLAGQDACFHRGLEIVFGYYTCQSQQRRPRSNPFTLDSLVFSVVIAARKVLPQNNPSHSLDWSVFWAKHSFQNDSSNSADDCARPGAETVISSARTGYMKKPHFILPLPRGAVHLAGALHSFATEAVLTDRHYRKPAIPHAAYYNRSNPRYRSIGTKQ